MHFKFKLKDIIKVLFINIIALITIVCVIDIIFLDNKMFITRCQYHPGLDIYTIKDSNNLIFKYDFYKIPFKEVVKRSYTMITDQDGCRIGSKIEIKQNNNNIVVIGDSFSFGCHANYENTIPGLLQKHYLEYNIWNFSVSGTSSYYYDKILSYYMDKKQITPKILIVGLYVDMQIGDIPRILARKKFGSYKAFDSILVGPSLLRHLKESYFHRLLFNSELYLRNKTSLINIFFNRKQPPDFAISLVDTLSQNMLSSLENMLLLNINNIRLISNLSPENIIIWFIPSNHELYHKIYKYKDRDNFYNLSKDYWDNIKIILKQKGYCVIDPRDIIDNLFIKENIYPYTVDGHFNENGFKCITQMIIREIDKHHHLKREVSAR